MAMYIIRSYIPVALFKALGDKTVMCRQISSETLSKLLPPGCVSLKLGDGQRVWILPKDKVSIINNCTDFSKFQLAEEDSVIMVEGNNDKTTFVHLFPQRSGVG